MGLRDERHGLLVEVVTLSQQIWVLLCHAERQVAVQDTAIVTEHVFCRVVPLLYHVFNDDADTRSGFLSRSSSHKQKLVRIAHRLLAHFHKADSLIMDELQMRKHDKICQEDLVPRFRLLLKYFDLQ